MTAANSAIHPFLDPDPAIRWSTLTPDRVVPDISHVLKEAQQELDAIAALADAPGAHLTFANTLLAIESATGRVFEAWSKVSLLDLVNNSKALRTAHNEMLPAVTRFSTSLYLNDRLWKLIRNFAASEASQLLNPIQRRFLDETIKDFIEHGADLPGEKKTRLQDLENELAEKTQKFSENVLDATNQWELIIDDENRLRGLPDSAREAARQNARSKGHGTDEKPVYRFTLHAPSFIPIMKYAGDESLRQEVWEAFTAIGAKEPSNNSSLLWEIIDLRHEKALLLGHRNFGDLVLHRRMAASGNNALAFVEDLFARTKPHFDRECRELHRFKCEATGDESPLKPWETAFYAEQKRRSQFDFDEEALRPYFPIQSVLSGMFELTSRVFGFHIRELPTIYVDPESGQHTPADAATDAIEVWHPEVHAYQLLDEDGRVLGCFYADWHPRESKRSGAWMGDLRTGNREPSTPPTPHLGYIAGNLTPPTDDKPALLTHDEVTTIFHEFGHLIHHLCGEVEVKSLNGIHVAWDFVELPSQILENWCWERESLDLFARHWQTGEPIPEALFQKMRETRNFHSAIAMMRQLSFGKIDLELHLNYADSANRPNGITADPDTELRKKLAPYLVPVSPDAPLNIRQFGHLFANPTGYAAGYYSYKWAEVLEADAFSRFQREGVLNSETGREFRRKILSRGNSEDPNVLFKDFMGREPDPEALLAKSGLASRKR